MNKTNFKKYLSHVKEKRKSTIEDRYIEKDYAISLFFSSWQKLKDEGLISDLDDVVFKGGTLLVRNYLNYSRVSEDIDFTYKDSNRLRKIKRKNQREKEIKKVVIPLINEINVICDSIGFDFDTDRTNPQYIAIRNSRSVYIFYVYYDSLITGEKIPIKIELNFLEHILYDCLKLKVNTIVDPDIYLKSIGYDVSNITMNTYALDEIILEKYRAVLTRKKLKERDVFDLYLIHQGCKNVIDFDEEMIFKKIESGFLISHVSERNLKHHCELLKNGCFGRSDDDIKRLSLVEIHQNDYKKFKALLYKKLEKVCQIGFT
jgi:predicted nucleotidyltransferase component of viral defense system